MGALCHAVLDNVTSRVLALTDIGVQETHQLSHLLGSLAENCETLFAPKKAAAAAAAAAAEKEKRLVIGAYVGNWERFGGLRGVLEASLSDIRRQVEGGEGVAALFTREELRGVVAALFNDSAARKAVMDMLKSDL